MYDGQMLAPATFAAIYFVVWWVCLFFVLPFGVHNQIESGSYIQGTERGAPAASPMWWRRVLWTTLLSIPVTLLLLWGVSNPVLQRYWNGA
jgi:predicted secreted protein